MDLTGGISERIQLDVSKRAPELYDVLKNTLHMNSMMGLSIVSSIKTLCHANWVFHSSMFVITIYKSTKIVNIVCTLIFKYVT